MPELSEFQAIVEAVGAADEAIAAVYQTGDADWTIFYDEATAVELTFDENQQKATLSTQIGQPAGERQLEVYSALLCYSSLWRDTGGVRAAVAGDAGEASLMCDWVPGEATAAELAIVAANLAEKGRVWREFVTSGEPGTEPPPFSESQGMRV